MGLSAAAPAVLCLAWAAPCTQLPVVAEAQAEESEPQMPGSQASAALARGRALKWEMRGQPPFRKEAVRLGAVRAFRAGTRGAGDRLERALCAFRAGELLRAAGLTEGALAEFSACVGIGASPWSHKGAIEGGKLLIGVGRGPEAAVLLERAMRAGVPSRFREHAELLRGVAFVQSGQRDAALEAWRAVAEHGVTPSLRLIAFERWGLALLDGGDVEGAAGVLHLCRMSLESASSGATELGAQLRTSLQLSRLGRAIRGALAQDEAPRATSDALHRSP